MNTDKKDEYIKKISALSDHRENLLIKLMDRYNVYNLQEITEQQAKKFYFKLIAAA